MILNKSNKIKLTILCDSLIHQPFCWPWRRQLTEVKIGIRIYILFTLVSGNIAEINMSMLWSWILAQRAHIISKFIKISQCCDNRCWFSLSLDHTSCICPNVKIYVQIAGLDFVDDPNSNDRKYWGLSNSHWSAIDGCM